MKKTTFLKAALFLSIIAAVTLLAVSCDLFNHETQGTSPTTQDTVTETDFTTEETTKAPCPGHEASEWIIDAEPTCAKEGSKHTECTLCGALLESEAIAALAHTEEIVEGTAPTCAAEGLTQGKKCSVCDAVLVEQESIPTLPHTESIIEDVAATCTENGQTQGKKCSVCDAVMLAPETVLALGHVESDWIIDAPATVGSEGSKHKECTACKAKLAEEIIPAIDEAHTHSANDWTVTKPATCIEAGEKALVCECGFTIETQVVEKTGIHSEVVVLGKAATCVTQGLTDGKKCSVCGTVTVKQTLIATGSHIEETVLGKAATCTESGTTNGKKCSVCGVFTVTQLPTAPLGHSFVSGTCSSCGFKGSYGIWITDGLGMPVSNIVVKILKDGEVVKIVQYSGQYSTFDLEDANYTVELDLSLLSDAEYVYDTESAVLSPDKKSLSLKLYRASTEEEMLCVAPPIDKDYNATYVGVGSYKVALTPNDYTFFIFYPSTAAIYTITYECDEELAISYHGSTFFTQGHDMSVDSTEFTKFGNGIAANIYPSNIGASYVFAIKSTSATECVFNIQNAGDPGTRLEDQPWTPYLEDAALIESMKNYPQTGEYTVIDLADTSITAVLNPSDGFYHLGSVDGPVIFIDFTTDSSYVANIFTICANQRIGQYIYDANGNPVEKRSYNELFIQCGMPDPTETSSVTPGIRVPMTEKLAEAVKSFGDKQGWWAEGSDSNIFDIVFNGAPYNREYAWLLYCGYYK